jgi:hypothetical protein
MKSGVQLDAQGDEPPKRVVNKLATFIGAAIALLTLVIPIYVIASYSSTSTDSVKPPQANLPKAKSALDFNP